MPIYIIYPQTFLLKDWANIMPLSTTKKTQKSHLLVKSLLLFLRTQTNFAFVYWLMHILHMLAALRHVNICEIAGKLPPTSHHSQCTIHIESRNIIRPFSAHCTYVQNSNLHFISAPKPSDLFRFIYLFPTIDQNAHFETVFFFAYDISWDVPSQRRAPMGDQAAQEAIARPKTAIWPRSNRVDGA